jgi:hypothetical protein
LEFRPPEIRRLEPRAAESRQTRVSSPSEARRRLPPAQPPPP